MHGKIFLAVISLAMFGCGNQAAVEKARADFNRFSELVKSGTVSKKVFEEYQKKYNVAQSQAALEQLEISLDETEIRASFYGILTAKYVEVGSMISQGTPLVAIQSPQG